METGCLRVMKWMVVGTGTFILLLKNTILAWMVNAQLNYKNFWTKWKKY